MGIYSIRKRQVKRMYTEHIKAIIEFCLYSKWNGDFTLDRSDYDSGYKDFGDWVLVDNKSYLYCCQEYINEASEPGFKADESTLKMALKATKGYKFKLPSEIRNITYTIEQGGIVVIFVRNDCTRSYKNVTHSSFNRLQTCLDRVHPSGNIYIDSQKEFCVDYEMVLGNVGLKASISHWAVDSVYQISECESGNLLSVFQDRYKYLSKVDKYNQKASRVPKKGWVYLLHAKDTESYKIGKSLKVDERKDGINLIVPFEMEEVWSSYFDDYAKTETKLKEMFAHRRIKGEWFNLTSEDIDRIKEYGG